MLYEVITRASSPGSTAVWISGMAVQCPCADGHPEMPVARITSYNVCYTKLLRESELVVAPYDPLVFNTDTAKWLLYMAYQRGLPVLGFSLSYVRAGALAAVYSTPEQMGRQAAESVRRWLRDGVRTLPQATYPAYFSVAVNHSVARTLGVEAPAPEVLMQKLSGSLAEATP